MKALEIEKELYIMLCHYIGTAAVSDITLWPRIVAGTKAGKPVLSASHKVIRFTCYLFI